MSTRPGITATGRAWFVDFVKPTRFPANVVNWALMNLAVFTPFIREGLDNHKAWEHRFYAEAETLRNRK
jgi:ornithine lipid ester-linked acyl 2-hydroxylase